MARSWRDRPVQLRFLWRVFIPEDVDSGVQHKGKGMCKEATCALLA